MRKVIFVEKSIHASEITNESKLVVYKGSGMIGIIIGSGDGWAIKLFNGNIVGSTLNTKKSCMEYANALGYTLYEVD